MLQQMTIQQLADKVLDMRTRRHDFLVDTADLAWSLADMDDTGDPGCRLLLHTRDEASTLFNGGLSDRAYSQVLTALGVPKKYADRLRTHPAGPVRELLPDQLNTLSEFGRSRRMIRTYGLPDRPPGYGATVRAFLSDRYRRLDNDRVLSEMIHRVPDDLHVESCAITDDHMYVKLVRDGTVLDDGNYLGGIQQGVVIRNSEVGAGALTVRPMLFRLVCSNGMTSTLAQRFVHLGSTRHDTGLVPFGDDTLRKEDAAILAKAVDAVAWAVSESTGRVLLADIGKAQGDTIRDAAKAVEQLADSADLTDDEGADVLRYLAEGGEFTRWGLVNAVTRASQDATDYGRGSQLEQLGGMVLAGRVGSTLNTDD